MKKVIALLAVGAFAIALVACGKKAEDTTEATDTTTVVETPAAASDSVADSTATSTDTTTVK